MTPAEGAVVLAQVVADVESDGMLETLEAETMDALDVVPDADEELVLGQIPNNGLQPTPQ
jgi:hypothetical protein